MMTTPANKLPQETANLIHSAPADETQVETAVRLGVSASTVRNYQIARKMTHKLLATGQRYMLRKDRKSVARSRKVLAEYFGMDVFKIPHTIHVHHRDGNCNDDSPRNLMFMTVADHKRLHYGYQVDLAAAEIRALEVLWEIEGIISY